MLTKKPCNMEQDWQRILDILVYSKNTQISDTMNILLWKQSCSMRTDGQTDRDEGASNGFS